MIKPTPQEVLCVVLYTWSKAPDLSWEVIGSGGRPTVAVLLSGYLVQQPPVYC